MRHVPPPHPHTTPTRVVSYLGLRLFAALECGVCVVSACVLRDPFSFRSVHLLNEELKAQMAADQKREEEEWHSKVVVDNIRFQPVFGYKKPSQVRGCMSRCVRVCFCACTCVAV